MFITFLLSRMVGVGLSVWMFDLTYRELVLRPSVIASFLLSILVVWSLLNGLLCIDSAILFPE